MPRSRPCAPALAPCVSLRTARTTSSFLLGLLCLLALATLSQGQNLTSPNCVNVINTWSPIPSGIVLDNGQNSSFTLGSVNVSLTPQQSGFHFYTNGTMLYGQVSALILGSSTPNIITSLRLENIKTGERIILNVFGGGNIEQDIVLSIPGTTAGLVYRSRVPISGMSFQNFTINWTPDFVSFYGNGNPFSTYNRSTVPYGANFSSPMRVGVAVYYNSDNGGKLSTNANYTIVSNLTISCSNIVESPKSVTVAPSPIATSIVSTQPQPTTTPPPVVDPPATSPAAIAVPVVVVVILVAAGVGFYKFRTRLGLDKFAGLGRQSGSGSSESRSAQPRAIPPIQMLQSNPSSTADPLQNSIQDREMTLPDRDVLSASSDHSATYRADQLSQADIPLSALDPSTGNRRGSIAKLGLPDHSFHDSQPDGNDHSVPAYPESSPNLLSRRHSSSTLPPPYYQSITYVPPPVPEITVYVSTSEPDSSDNTNNPPTTNRESMLSGTTDSVPQN
ncbi:uncharacterized protein BJ171DRAFT_521567 [Polychytrium aggregatum]|uniref:uncharacterized protein n=1 Tax=Polychytrium aggregatum TaxID=110093 RepID=UPI0022FDE796|nr:uncharacterized protein BJ171DRAFT_521567 [Polychytrium aggregatum]KAI9197214.1 hypothetical protein BJ171DRAFT_521567 [Polychytrium aggregatum]